jgi:AAA+ ATPase superfamily predicted ATPase
MRNVTGAIAKGDDFFNRANEMQAFWSDLATDSLLLLAPRRVGKTSLMKKMGEDAAQYGFATAYVDVSDSADELRFVQRLYGAILDTQAGDRLWNQIKDSWLGQTLKRVQKVGGGGFTLEFSKDETSWTRLGEELADALSKLEGRWLIQVDELPVFVLVAAEPRRG